MHAITRSRWAALLAFCLALVLTGCAQTQSQKDTRNRTLIGGAIGVAAGAAIGEMATGQPLTGAAIGAGVGMASGWLYDRHKKKQE